jgi:hypothetical protein
MQDTLVVNMHSTVAAYTSRCCRSLHQAHEVAEHVIPCDMGCSAKPRPALSRIAPIVKLSPGALFEYLFISPQPMLPLKHSHAAY